MPVSRKKKRLYYGLGVVIAVFVCFLLIPTPGFKDSLSTVLYDKDYRLLSARVADDEQWRFPQGDSIPYRFATCIKYFEDEYFECHPGFNPASLIRAVYQNIRKGRIVSGGSTISMQVVRLSRKGKPRTILEKLIELVLAMRLEADYDKDEILNLYSSYAPFGGNVVGLEAASWRYYGRPSNTLSWGESASLAVLPNAPSIIYPGKSEDLYLKKRNRLLNKLYKSGVIDSVTVSLSKLEDLPSSPFALPNYAPHLLQTLIKQGRKEEIIHSSLDIEMQMRYSDLLNRYHRIYSQNEVHNGAILVVENETRKIRAYVGNTDCPKEDAGSRVDIITSKRSTGSLLKPFLYASAMDDGRITGKSLIPDIPTRIAGFAPRNFNKKFAGAEQAYRALTKSLNIPAVRLLRDYGLEKFNHLMKDLNLKSINKGPDHYGLSIILGGAESSLFELAGAYSGMANQLNHYFDLNDKFYDNEYSSLNAIENKFNKERKEVSSAAISTGAIWNVFKMLTDLKRPGLLGDWKLFESSKRIAWKTGTSYGFRDAWSIGTTPEYTVGVWIGNASGEGRPHLIGLETAAPVMFDVFSRLPATTWFTEPFDDLAEIKICSKGGDLFTSDCEEFEIIKHPYSGQHALKTCTYHRKVHLSSDELYQVNSSCYPISKMINKSWFVLPPAMERYYIMHTPDYIRLPPQMPGCGGAGEIVLQIIYPKNNTVVRIPKNLNGELGRVVLEAAHNYSDIPIYWHLDDQYLETTSGPHKIEILPKPGKHVLTLLDELGNTLEVKFVVLD